MGSWTRPRLCTMDGVPLKNYRRVSLTVPSIRDGVKFALPIETGDILRAE